MASSSRKYVCSWKHAVQCDPYSLTHVPTVSGKAARCYWLGLGLGLGLR